MELDGTAPRSPGEPAGPRLLAAVDSAPVAVAVVRGGDRTVVYLNPAAVRLFGLAASAATGGSSLDALGLSEIARRVDEVVASGRARHDDDLRTGAAGSHALSYSPIAGAPGAAPDVLVVGVDVSAQADARRAVARRADEQSLLDRASAALQTATDPVAELEALTRALVPRFTDACSAILLDAPAVVGAPLDEVRGQRVAFASAPDLAAIPPGLASRLTWGGSGLLADAVRAGRPRSARMTGGTADAARRAGLLPWLEEVGVAALAAAPVLVDGAVVGVLVFASRASRPPVSRADLAVMERIAARAGAALGQGLADVRQRETSLALQRSMLTDAPTVPDLTVVARYRPSAVDAEVGGDWYDAFALPGGDLAVAIGDVAGHDLAAAATMGQLRSMLRATAYDRDGEAPGAVLARLDRAAVGLAVTEFTSVLLGRLRVDPAAAPARRAVLRWSNAGHPAPVLVAPDGRVEVLEDARGAVLGVLPDRPRPTASVAVPAGSFLLLHTDGLVERRGREDDASITTVVAEAAARGDGTLERLCDELLAEAPPVDDVAVLAVCVGS